MVAADFVSDEAAEGRGCEGFVRGAAEGLVGEGVGALLLPVVFDLAFDGGAFPDVRVDVGGLPWELVVRAVRWFAGDVSEGVVINTEACGDEFGVGVADEDGFVFEGFLEGVGEELALGGGGGWVVVFAEVADEAHLDGEDAGVVVPCFAESGDEGLEAGLECRAVVVESVEVGGPVLVRFFGSTFGAVPVEEDAGDEFDVKIFEGDAGAGGGDGVGVGDDAVDGVVVREFDGIPRDVLADEEAEAAGFVTTEAFEGIVDGSGEFSEGDGDGAVGDGGGEGCRGGGGLIGGEEVCGQEEKKREGEEAGHGEW